MPDYDLNRLGSRAFEQMIVALGRLEIGPGVRVFGDGPDGGREATFDGTINWSATSAGVSDQADAWTGYTVLQSKFQIKPKAEPRDNALWLQGEISREIASWVKAAKGRTRSRLPDYLIFVTNIDLSPVAKTGGIDTLHTFVSGKLKEKETVKAGLRVKGFMIWHAEQVRSMIDAHQDVRWAYPGLLTVGDVLALLGSDNMPLGSMDLRDPLREEMLRSLKLDRYIRLGQAGGPGDATLWLDEIAIDVPARLDGDEGTSLRAVRHILDLGETNLRQRQADRIERPNVVIVGGPGQGKSTLSQLIAQAYRVAMLTEVSLGPSTDEVVKGTAAALDRLGLAAPRNRRWPVRVDLAKYAEELSTGSETTLLRWISKMIQKRTEQDIQPGHLREWLKAWPWALILDGLDEVPSAAARRMLYQQIENLLTTAEDLDADLLVVITTRPTGYDERFAPDRYQHLYLQRLSAREAAEFSLQITNKRFVNDDEMRVKVADRMAEASRDPVSARLMETPLQVTIMSFIVEKYPNLPPDRFTLFNLYYSTMCDREGGKEIAIARFIVENRPRIDRLHEQVGLVLQAESEVAEGAEASMQPEDLRKLARQQLLERGFAARDAESIAEQLVDAATRRLVLLTPRDGGVGFEIRSLQELMAARALTEGEDSDVLGRLRLVGHSPHWRNTWLLAAGHLLLTSERFEKLIIRLLRDLDNEPRRFGGRYPTAPLLAADIIADNLAVARPNFERALVQRVFAILNRPPVVGLDQIAKAVSSLARTRHRETIYDLLKSAAPGSAASRAAASLVLRRMQSMTGSREPQVGIRLAMEKINLSAIEERAVSEWLKIYMNDAARSPSTRRGKDVVDHLARLAEATGLDGSMLETLRDGLTVVAGSIFEPVDDGHSSIAVLLKARAGDPTALVNALENEDISVSLDLALDTLPSSHWAVEELLGWAVKPALDRLPVGPEVVELVRNAKTEESTLDDI
ncbi:NACHT domain-containing protein [Micromonospora sp. CA-248212]|uniref:NACHT domain-containing protein n=1 Tax=Micromonospora sp. CA-248212 TaxID=3239961 RepID=UPI003D8E31E5